jgi:hypothetical protein
MVAKCNSGEMYGSGKFGGEVPKCMVAKCNGSKMYGGEM